ncbi:hypothetical protein FB45DRAFT_706602, partial [Roridomyces roridus]
PTTKRPGEVHYWVSRGRKTEPEPVDIATFPMEFWAWWGLLNPQWRVKEGVLVQSGSGSWTELEKPGINGLLSVLYCLKWWEASVETDAERLEWERAVRDVLWTLEQ